MQQTDYEVLLFYRYVTVDNPQEFCNQVRELAVKHNLTGRVIVASEGINATLEGQRESNDAFLRELLEDPRLQGVSIKRSPGDGKTFPKLSVKVRNEIVGTRFDASVDPRVQTAKRLPREELHQWFKEDKAFTIVDMRNSYEFASGHFRNSVDPGLQASRDLPAAMEKLEPLKERTVVTVCTGGVRCEKMSAYLLANGFTDVYQLEDGMHGYMERYPGEDFLGTLYTFDQRVTMDFGGDREIVGRCVRCESPTERYVNCANDPCHIHCLICTRCGEAGKTHCSEACEVA